jgi:hypothetical protein
MGAHGQGRLEGFSSDIDTNTSGAVKEMTIDINSLKPVGFFKELDSRIVSGPSLKEARSDQPLVQEQRVVEYLRGCPVIMWTPDLLRDALQPEVEVGILAIQSDGVWQWRSDLAYYVEEYHTALDRDFVMHMALRNWSVPADVPVCADPLFQ